MGRLVLAGTWLMAMVGAILLRFGGPPEALRVALAVYLLTGTLVLLVTLSYGPEPGLVRAEVTITVVTLALAAVMDATDTMVPRSVTAVGLFFSLVGVFVIDRARQARTRVLS